MIAQPREEDSIPVVVFHSRSGVVATKPLTARLEFIRVTGWWARLVQEGIP